MSQMFDAQAYNDANAGKGYDKQWCEFAWEGVPDGEGGFNNVAYIRIRTDRLNEIFRPVNDADKINYKSRYEAFVEGNEEPPEGTPIKEWAVPTAAERKGCQVARIYTIEQLSESPDEGLQKAGLISLKYKAIDWLEHNEDAGILAKLRDELDRANEKIAILEEKNQALTRKQNDPPN